MQADRFDVRQVCLNGHLITANAKSAPRTYKPFCGQCGERTILACPKCKSPLQGADTVAQTLDIFYQLPTLDRYCDRCGDAFPWTATLMDTAMELAGETDGVSEAELNQLRSLLPSLSVETPKTPSAITRWKKVVSKGSSTVSPLLQKVLLELCSAGIKHLFGW